MPKTRNPQPPSRIHLPLLIHDDLQIVRLAARLRQAGEPGVRGGLGRVRDGDEGDGAVGAGGFAEVEEGFLGEGAAAVAEEGYDEGGGGELDFGGLGCFGAE